VQGIDVGVAAGFDKLSNRVTTKASVHKDGTTVHLDYDNVDRRPEVYCLFTEKFSKFLCDSLCFMSQLSVEQHINENNIINPSIVLTNGDITYAWLRRWSGGSLRTSLHPGDKLTFDWRDESHGGGSWNTHAEVPIDDISKARVSISRDWKY
jgi:hypothetical protein